MDIAPASSTYNQTVAAIPVDSQALGLALSADGTYLCVTNSGGTLSVIDTTLTTPAGNGGNGADASSTGIGTVTGGLGSQGGAGGPGGGAGTAGQNGKP